MLSFSCNLNLQDQHLLNWLLQSSHDPAHLLLKKNGTAVVSSHESHVLPNEADFEWKTGSEYHFKSIAAIQLLRHVSLNFHKDFTLEQVNGS